MQLGLIGLGKMGGNMAERIRRAGHEVVGYDHSPGKRDVETLQALGMGDRPINQGPLNMGYVMNAVTAWAGGPDRLRRLRVRFLGNVLAGHHLRVRATVTALREEDGVRLADCDVVLEGDAYASSRHASVFARDGARYVRDLGSTNGTHVDGHQIVAEHRLRPGDELRVGETELRYEE